MNFGENLKKLRKLKKLSQESLAEKMNVSRQSVSKWETGDAYPEMNNLLELCKIFHCKISDLINDNIMDIDSFDDDIKTNISTLKENEQKKMKDISNAISIMANIGRIICIVCIPIIICSMFILSFFSVNIKVEDDKVIWKDKEIDYKINNKKDKYSIVLKYNDVTITDGEEVDYLFVQILNFIKNNSKLNILFLINLGLLMGSISLFILSRVFLHLNKLFSNIYNLETPFTFENVGHIKKMAWLMIFTLVFSKFFTASFLCILTNDFNFGIEMMDVVEILFLFSMAYIFEYGRLIQLDSNKKMYD